MQSLRLSTYRVGYYDIFVLSLPTARLFIHFTNVALFFLRDSQAGVPNTSYLQSVSVVDNMVAQRNPGNYHL